MHRQLVGLLTLALVSTTGANWPHWRGPATNGVSDATGLPTTWSPTENVLWRTPLPGPAGSTPLLAGGRLFLTTPDGAELLLAAYDAATGEPLWRRTVTTGEAAFRGDEGNLASPSPATDGRSVVAVMGDGTMACYTVEGEPVWRLSLNERLTPLDIQFGYASSPIVHDGYAYVQWIHGDGDAATAEARIACFDLETGKTVWSVKRETGANRECEHSYASPIIAGAGADAVLIAHGGDATTAHDLQTGAEQWRLMGFNPPGSYHPTLRFVASPAWGDGLVVAPTAKQGAVAAVQLGGSGDVTGGEFEAWRLDKGTPDVPSPLVADGLVYLCGENGNLTCFEAKTGKRVYRERTVSDRYRASPLLADGKLYLTSRRGVVTVVKAGRDFEQLAQNDLGEAISSSPVPGDGVLYLRTFDALYAIGER
ncbi:outer membrane biogenesis protein BamB [Botrimarina colliarenosi]|uniref:Outer membrane biogenesis protein BamB n=1 Tax=Botrimarina colliarenosi TaxID=2528001 RepID=A0A5C6AC96_9BACT|nr:PQQ-binding-like beta-propeller repeat protein [Botrimarina colliarenosi]TWT97036.1 outer membrane biogenesis protein BamB [Botrimarina colliarenosi]